MIDSMNLQDKTFKFAERFVLVLFQVIIHDQRLVNFAVGSEYKYTNLSKRGKNFTQDFFHYLAQR